MRGVPPQPPARKPALQLHTALESNPKMRAHSVRRRSTVSPGRDRSVLQQPLFWPLSPPIDGPMKKTEHEIVQLDLPISF